ncbi:Snf7 family [Pelagophyceae sp. CCMP2097]|nr:Snf7 family [Pelagophyceae sp. CCMP2097]
MKRIFGAKKDAPAPPSLNDAGVKVEARCGALDEKIGKLDQELSGYKEKMKKARGPALNTLKQRAMAVLKRKKMYEQQRDQMAGQAFNIEQTNFAIDSVKDTITTVDAMRQASKVLKKEIKKVNVDGIEDLQDDLADMMEDMHEVQDALGRSYGLGDEIDEADLDAELACLGDELGLDDLDAEADSTPAYLTPALPEQPTNEPSTPAAVDEFGLPVAQTS